MQEYWEIYMKNLEGKPASILFNAGISMDMEEIRYTYPTIAFIKVRLKKPKENGLLSKEEERDILSLEDKLEAALIKFRIGKYVGRVISDGYVTFLYYLQFTYNWQDFLEFALDKHQTYEISAGHQEDSEWNYYKNLLFPTDREWQIIQNHKVCDLLQSKGDRLEHPRSIKHKIFFINSTEKQKGEFLKMVEDEGFIKIKTIKSEEGIEGVVISRDDNILHYNIDEITLRLIELSEEYGAGYDGWEVGVEN